MTTPRNAIGMQEKALSASIVRNSPVDFHRALLKGADFRAVDIDRGADPLGLAAHCGHAHFVAALLEYGADPDAASPEGITAAMRAARSGSTACMDLLEAAGADFKAVAPNGQNALTLACDFSRSESVAYLLKRGLDPNHRMAPDGATPAFISVGVSDAATLRLLLDAGADPGCAKAGRSLLHACVASHDMDSGPCADLLLSRGADLHWRDRDGLTPLDLANENSRPLLAAIFGSWIDREREREAIGQATRAGAQSRPGIRI